MSRTSSPTTTMSFWDRSHRVSSAGTVCQNVHRPRRHDSACLRHLGRCQPTLSSSVSTIVQYRWTGGGWLWDPGSIVPTTAVMLMESAHHVQHISENWPPPWLAWAVEVVGVQWETGRQTGKPGSLGGSQRCRPKTVDDGSGTTGAGRLDLPLSGRLRVL